MKKLIFVLDLDSFFSSAEVSRDPSLEGKPVVVGRSDQKDKGVCIAVSYKARESGIYVGCPLYKARRLCPDLIFLESDFDFYLEKSEQTFQIVKSMVDKIELGSIDEAYADVTEAVTNSGLNAIEYARKIQLKVLRETGLGISIGISNNRILSKMASGMDKPLGITTLFEREMETKLWDKGIQELYYVGSKSREKLEALGYFTIGDVANVKQNSEEFEKLLDIFGVHFNVIWGFANGLSSDRINHEGRHLVKSIGKAETVSKYIDDYDDAKDLLFKLTDVVVKRLNYRNMICSNVSIGYKDIENHLGAKVAGKKITRKMVDKSNDFEYIFSNVMYLFENKVASKMPFKYLSVSVEGLEDAYYLLQQKNLFDTETDEKSETRLMISDLNRVIGYEALTDADSISKYKKYVDKSLTNDDKIKFKTWS